MFLGLGGACLRTSGLQSTVALLTYSGHIRHLSEYMWPCGQQLKAGPVTLMVLDLEEENLGLRYPGQSRIVPSRKGWNPKSSQP